MMWVMALTLGMGLAQAVVAIGCMILWMCFYVSFERTLRLVMPDE